MNDSIHYEFDPKKVTIADRFRAAAQISEAMKKNALLQGDIDAQDKWTRDVAAMAEIFASMSYSDGMVSDVTDAAREAGESIRDDRYYKLACDNWDTISGDPSRLEDFTVCM